MTAQRAAVVLFDAARPLRLASGARLAPVEVAYETYGTLDEDRTNAVFVCHALTGDAHAAGPGGWWETLIGPGRPVDTDRFFVIAPNLLGGCRGTTGPSSIDPATGEPYGTSFPVLQVEDLVTVHRALLAHLGITRLHAAIGGSLGGMQALQWALDAGEEVQRAILVCASARLTAMNIGFSAVARSAITAAGADGMAVARRMAHLTYLSESGVAEKFGRRRRAPGAPPTLASDFEVEHYLDHQAEVFLARFDPLTYLYLTRVMDYFDPFAAPPPDGAAPATAFSLLSFDTDWRFGPEHSAFIEQQLRDRGARVTHETVASPWGHDSFLLEVPAYHAAVRAALA